MSKTIMAIKYSPQGRQETEISIEEVRSMVNRDQVNTDFSAENKSNITIPLGWPCATHPSGVGILPANSINLWAFGLASEQIEPTFAGVVVSNGVLVLTDWTEVTGTVTLEPKAVYYLAHDGGLSTEITGQFVQQIGISIAPNTLEIQISQPILL